MKFANSCIAALGTILLSTQVMAVPFTFSAGEPARAADVNANFTDLDNRVTSNATNITTNTANITNNTAAIAAIPGATLYDYNKFVTGTNVISKTFALQGSFCGSANREVRSYTWTSSGANTDVVMTQKWDDAGTVCTWRDFHYLQTPTQRQLLGSNMYDTSGTLVQTYTLDTPIILASNAMAKGTVFGTAAIINVTPAGGSASFAGSFVQTKVALEVENVTVPAGTFSACLKTSTFRSSYGFGAYQRISWDCPGVGEVKRILHSSDNTIDRVWELSAISYATP